MSAAASGGAALVRRLGAVLEHGRIEELDEILTPDCRDENPLAVQLPGRVGVALKAAWYRTCEPESRMRFVAFDEDGSVVIAEWITELPGRDASRWRGRFVIEGDRIAAFEVIRVG
ncbi:nuclear transport factor 2 family protein [Sorangium sp. So ce375]|uniref:nuclear transport factor 2 family protein n=1 Tax=Sorangium sp. So ce375 TaxID=3133306 RepID=UPI003F5BA696